MRDMSVRANWLQTGNGGRDRSKVKIGNCVIKVNCGSERTKIAYILNNIIGCLIWMHFLTPFYPQKWSNNTKTILENNASRLLHNCSETLSSVQPIWVKCQNVSAASPSISTENVSLPCRWSVFLGNLCFTGHLALTLSPTSLSLQESERTTSNCERAKRWGSG